MNLKVDKNYLTDTLVKLVQIDSRNPSLCSDGPGEIQCAEYIAELFKKLEIDYKIHRFSSKQANIVARIKGKGNGKTFLLNAHMDTVGTGGMKSPFSGNIIDGKIFGRGSHDMKGSLAAIISVAKTLVDNNIELDGDLIIAAVADEEYSSIGTTDLIKNYTADTAIVTEPTNFSLVTAHRGFIWYEVETIGKAAHGSKYDIGIDANMHMGRFLAELDKLEKKLRKQKPAPLVGLPSLHASIINGGTDISTYSAKCTLKIERRTVPGEKESGITNELQNIIDKLSVDDVNFKATVKPFFQRPQFNISSNAEIVKTAESVLNEHFNKHCTFAGAPYWTDAALLSEAGIDTIIIGPIGDGLHTTEEWVDINSLVDLTAVLTKIAITFCKEKK
jgi:acetylornithine deacetylase